MNESIELQSLAKLAEMISEPIARELNAAIELAEAKLYTEAGLRIGRCLEATLYALARENSVELQDRILPSLKPTKDKIRQAEVEILRTSGSDEIRQLDDALKLLENAISELSRSDHARVGVFSNEPRKPNSLLRDLIRTLKQNKKTEPASKLKQFNDLLGRLTEMRNNAAHAALDGSLREIDPSLYEEFASSTALFVQRSLQILIGSHAPAFLENEESH
jgi:hypothetical protein